MKTQRALFAFVLMLAATFLPADSAEAGDKKVYPASMCHSWGGNDPGDDEFLLYSQHGRIFNSHATERLGVVCPVPRDETNAALSHLRVYVNDGSNESGSAGQVRCTLMANNVWGNSVVDSAVSETGSGQLGTIGMTFHSPDVTQNGGSHNESNYTLFCLLPADDVSASFIGSYAIIEGSDTSND